MTTTDCPECGYASAHADGKGTNGGEAVHYFSCPECEHSWNQSIL